MLPAHVAATVRRDQCTLPICLPWSGGLSSSDAAFPAAVTTAHSSAVTAVDSVFINVADHLTQWQQIRFNHSSA
jgi:hypothetical protein